MRPIAITSYDLRFVSFDDDFLEKSWHWLHDPEIKRLTMTPDFTREQQLRWFAQLQDKSDYRIWGLIYKDKPVGAVGLKYITSNEAEYWGYIGERSYWGCGLGKKMMRFAIEEASKMQIRELYLKVHCENSRAISLYTKAGFATEDKNGDVYTMRMRLKDSHAI